MTTIRVPITVRGAVIDHALIDDVDAYLLAYRWHPRGNGYAAAQIDGTRTYLHRAVLGLGPDDDWLGDHKNGRKLDNRRSNLRCLDQSGNQSNRRGARRDASLPRGVVLDKRRGTYSARVTVNGKTHYQYGLRSVAAADRAAQELRRRFMPFSPEARLGSA